MPFLTTHGFYSPTARAYLIFRPSLEYACQPYGLMTPFVLAHPSAHFALIHRGFARNCDPVAVVLLLRP